MGEHDCEDEEVGVVILADLSPSVLRHERVNIHVGSSCTSLTTGASFGVQCQLRYVSSSRFSSNVGTRDHPLLLLLRNLQLILQAAGTDTSTCGAEPSHDIIQINHHVPSCRHPSTRSMSARVSSSLSASYVASVACSALRPLHRDTLSDSSDLPAPESFEARCEALRRSLPSSPSQINEHSSNQNRSNMQMGPPTIVHNTRIQR